MRFWLFLIVVAVVGFGLGSGLAYGLHRFSPTVASPPQSSQKPSAAPGTPSAPAASVQQGTPLPSTPSAPVPSAQQTTPAPGSPTPAGRGGAGQSPGGAGGAVTGTIARIEGDSMVVSTPRGERSITLGPQTAIQKLEAATRADLRPGAQVTALGQRRSEGAVAALTVTIGAQGFSPMSTLGGMGGMSGGTGQRGLPVSGTVSQAQGDALIVDTSQGQVTVALGPDTIIQRVAAAKREELTVGATILATGSPSPDQSGFVATSIVIMPVSAR